MHYFIILKNIEQYKIGSCINIGVLVYMEI